jgi:hypothetical protein
MVNGRIIHAGNSDMEGEGVTIGEGEKVAVCVGDWRQSWAWRGGGVIDMEGYGVGEELVLARFLRAMSIASNEAITTKTKRIATSIGLNSDLVGGLGEVVAVCEGEVDEVGRGVEMVVIGEVGFGIASGFGMVSVGFNVTVPTSKLFLWSYIVWLMTEGSVVPHQLFAAFMLPQVEL